MLRPLLYLLFGLVCLSAQAGVYTYIDQDGNRVFTDQPRSENAEQIKLAPSNDMQATDVPRPPPTQLANPPEAPYYQFLRILVPEPDATIRDLEGNLIVTLTSEPSLLPGHNFRLLMDGNPVGDVGRSPVFPLQNIDRGTHQLSAEIIDADGRIVERTPSQPFHMKRTSLAEKRRAHPCEKGDYGVRPECPLSDKPEEPKDIPLIPFI
ncbi:penicillin-binding protein [Pseudomonas alcaligenes]|uniref:Penicillin-binding protein n=1 Tax=Aquipseudomonas alcaligenes TaxID=43263 RepID=A0ABR7S7C4_AQUAC|nr:DUF4124 domain-containing protein [Pseudomonas alcaligenes]MBC9252511.1 penicillin-binding protein [Pseudomonas alcaligenes]